MASKLDLAVNRRCLLAAPPLCVLLLLGACSQGDAVDGPMLRAILDVDPNGERLDNFGQPAPAPPTGHAAQSPDFIGFAGHAVELVATDTTPLGGGVEIFDRPHRNGGIDFDQLPLVAPGEEFFAVPIQNVAPGNYPYLRLAATYQRFGVTGHEVFMGIPVTAAIEVAAFVDDETWIETYELGDETVEVHGLRQQGYYGAWSSYTGVIEGQAPVGATTVPNPLDATSPIPVGSCIITGVLDTPLSISGDETEDIVLHFTLTTNQSFEWVDANGDGLWQPLSEQVVDMGIRGLVVTQE